MCDLNATVHQLELRENDVLVLQTARPMYSDEIDKLRQKLVDAGFGNVQILNAGREDALSIMRDERAAAGSF